MVYQKHFCEDGGVATSFLLLGIPKVDLHTVQYIKQRAAMLTTSCVSSKKQGEEGHQNQNTC